MLCEKCGKKSATMHYQQIVNGVKTEYHLCSDCAGDENITTNFLSFDPFDLFGGIKYSDKVCPTCGMSLSDFKAHSILGCSDCYSAFESQLSPMLMQFHGCAKHVGSDRTNKKEKTDADTPTLSSLEKALKDAVLNEEYENAAILRDKIRKMKEAE